MFFTGRNNWGQLGKGDFLDRGDDPSTMGGNLTAVDLGSAPSGNGTAVATAVSTGQQFTCVLVEGGRVKVRTALFVCRCLVLGLLGLLFPSSMARRGGVHVLHRRHARDTSVGAVQRRDRGGGKRLEGSELDWQRHRKRVQNSSVLCMHICTYTRYVLCMANILSGLAAGFLVPSQPTPPAVPGICARFFIFRFVLVAYCPE